MESPALVATFATEAEADAEAKRLTRDLGERSDGYFYVSVSGSEGRWGVERRGGPVRFRDQLRHALKPWRWEWWWWS